MIELIAFLFLFVAFSFVLSVSAYKIGFNYGSYSTLKKLKKVNDRIEKGEYVFDEWQKFLLDLDVKKHKPPDFVDLLRGKHL